MERPQFPIKIFIRVLDSPDGDLDVATAFTKHPNAVREALLDEIRRVKLNSIDIALLQIEDAFWSALELPWTEPKTLRPVLEACRQGKITSRAEKLFYEHGNAYGVAFLYLATKPDRHRLFRQIDLLNDEELIELIKHVNNIPIRKAIGGMVDEFLQTPEGIVSDPPPRFTRPRERRKEAMRSPSPISNKRRRHDDYQNVPVPVPTPDKYRVPVQNHVPFPAPPQARSSVIHYTHSTPSIIPTPVLKNKPRVSHSQASKEQKQPNEEGRFMEASREFIAGQPSTLDNLQSPEQWNISGRDFNSSRPSTLLNDLPPPEQWNISGRDFNSSRPSTLFNDLPPPEQWNISGRYFNSGRPSTLLSDLQSPEQWNIYGRDFSLSRPASSDNRTHWQDYNRNGMSGADSIPGQVLQFDGQFVPDERLEYF